MDLIDRLRTYASTRKGELADLITEAADALERQTCEDAVSRQQAIDALMVRDKELRNINWYDKPYAEGECRGIDEALAIVSKLPSVQPQPEIIRCKDCRFQDKGRNESESWNLCGYRPWLHVPTEDEHYCGYAERRTEND